MAAPTKSQSIMHSIKGKIFSGEKHVDSEYETSYIQFQKLSESLHKLKTSAQAYSNAMYATLHNSNTTALEFANLLDDPITENGYETVSKQLLTAHVALGTERQTSLAARLTDQVLQPLDAIILGYLELNGRVAKRNELHQNFEYYLKKVHDLTRERDERGSKGKPESASQREKHDRNQSKLDSARQEYQMFSQPLITDLHASWNNRATAVGPIMAAFASIEKEYVQVYQQQLNNVHPEQVGVQAPRLSGATVAASATTAPMTLPSQGSLSSVSATAGAPVVLTTSVNDATPGMQTATTTLPQHSPVDTVQTPIQTQTTPIQQQQHYDQQQQQQIQQPAQSQQQYQPALAASAGSDVFSEMNDQSSRQVSPVHSNVSHSLVPAGSSAAAVGSNNPFESEVTAEEGVPTVQQAPFAAQSSLATAAPHSSPDVINTVPSAANDAAVIALPGAAPAARLTEPEALPAPKSAALKSDFEDESKRQRFEEDNKTANIIGI